MKSKHYISLILGIAILFFSSCDPGVDYRQIVQNDSKYDIMLIVDTAHINVHFGYTFDTLLIAKHSNVVIACEQGLGTTNGFSSCNSFNDSVYTKIVDNDHLHLDLDLNNSSNWVFDVLDESMGGGGECECRIKITDSMIK